MAIDKTEKKRQFLKAVQENAVALVAARQEATRLREKMASDPGVSDLADADAGVFVGAYGYMSLVIVNNYLGVTGDVEKAFTAQVVATSNRLPSLLAALPS